MWTWTSSHLSVNPIKNCLRAVVFFSDGVSIYNGIPIPLYNMPFICHSYSNHIPFESHSYSIHIPFKSHYINQTYIPVLNLVGGLEHEFYFSIYWEFHIPNWLSYFSEGLKPPTSHILAGGPLLILIYSNYIIFYIPLSIIHYYMPIIFHLYPKPRIHKPLVI